MSADKKTATRGPSLPTIWAGQRPSGSTACTAGIACATALRNGGPIAETRPRRRLRPGSTELVRRSAGVERARPGSGGASYRPRHRFDPWMRHRGPVVVTGSDWCRGWR
jgi:hypothetical protein